MGNSETAITKISQAREEQERTYTWLSRKSGVPYKRLLAELKHKRRPLSLETALSVGAALGLDLPELVEITDAHLVHEKDGSLTHLDPAEMRFNGKPLAFDRSFGDGSWRRTDLTDSAFEGRESSGRVVGAGEAVQAVEPENRGVREAVLP